MSIKEIRKELGLTQAGFASMFGVHQTAVSQWETGRTCPDTEMIVQIARGTNHTVDEVLGVHTKMATVVGAAATEIEMPDDGMAGAGIHKGNRVYIVNSDEKPEDGSLVGIRRRKENTVRFVRFLGDKMFFVDAQIPAEIRMAEESDEIIGNVYGVYADFGLENLKV